jgi:hypothetical protein
VAESDDLRAFIRDLMARFDRGMESLVKEHAAAREESRRYFEVLHAQNERENKRVDDLLAESGAQRQALLHILDELRGNGGPATAGG